MTNVQCKSYVGWFLIGCAIVVGLGGCSPDGDKNAQTAHLEAGVVAKVGNVTLTEQQFTNYLQSIQRSNATGEVRSKILEDWVTQELLSQAGKSEKLQDNEDVASRLANAQRRILSEAYLELQLETRLTDEILRAAYDSNIDKFSTKELHLAHILLDGPTPASDPSEKLVELANEISGKVSEGQSFSELASRYSLDENTSARGGDLGWIPIEYAERMYGKEISNVPPGKVVGPVQSTDGWHMIVMLEPIRETHIPYEDAKRILKEQQRQSMKNTLVRELRGKTAVAYQK